MGVSGDSNDLDTASKVLSYTGQITSIVGTVVGVINPLTGAVIGALGGAFGLGSSILQDLKPAIGGWNDVVIIDDFQPQKDILVIPKGFNWTENRNLGTNIDNVYYQGINIKQQNQAGGEDSLVFLDIAGYNSQHNYSLQLLSQTDSSWFYTVA